MLKCKVISKALSQAVEKLLLKEKSPSRKVGEIDNRGSHFYLALYWAEFLSKQDDNKELKNEFTQVYEDLNKNEESIMNEINSFQGIKVDLGGYYNTEVEKTKKIMRPSATFNEIIDNI